MYTGGDGVVAFVFFKMLHKTKVYVSQRAHTGVNTPYCGKDLAN